MNALRALYHVIRADFLERARRYSFLIILAGTICAGYLAVPSLNASYVILASGSAPNLYRGVYDSAWIGTVTAWLTSMFLSLFGFYLVKGAVKRDQRMRVGQILAATPISKSLYALGKWLSNLAVLGAIVGLMVIAAGVMQFIRGEDLHLDVWLLLSPSLLVTLPAMAVTAALAVLFETIPGLRGGFGNVVYFFAWIGAIFGSVQKATMTGTIPVYDVTGGGLIMSSIQAAAEASIAGPGRGINGILTGISPASIHTFRWKGIQWTSELAAGRLIWIGIALGLVLFAAALLHRFDPSRRLFRLKRSRSAPEPSVGLETHGSAPEPRLGPLTSVEVPSTRFHFWRTLLAELRLILKGQHWWWYVVALGLVVAGLLTPVDAARRTILPIAWLWPLLIWSEMGAREMRHRTDQLIFSGPHPLRRQLPATWLGGVVVAALTGSGVVVRLMLAGSWTGTLAWAVGALFVPTLALALGCWSSNSRLFEVVYVILWYLGPIQGVTALDYIGASNESIAAGMPAYYLGLTIILLGFAVFGRRRQLQV